MVPGTAYRTLPTTLDPGLSQNGHLQVTSTPGGNSWELSSLVLGTLHIHTLLDGGWRRISSLQEHAGVQSPTWTQAKRESQSIAPVAVAISGAALQSHLAAEASSADAMP
ncbi:uncharacterized protein BDCG_05022 [Blastomyces dermatitidis ER-3]|uniref:Uncharacterized protein n=1 Tax=Ajellomyces dermatitidis (strain ER-3 / ATCC MYA-2586) TaxID=559297 RepID=A0ABX2VX69_AJEDR|nr:uncharacterized protein BDCG_05022 [Blastomyces dermatitidis ER-3]OAT01368.1 hypothetical protein BDCG_05022 [Blastomyces dermatitidis ER-3]